MSLCEIDPYLISYRDVHKCIDYIINLDDDKNSVILIISTNKLLFPSDAWIQQCAKLSQIESIYILSTSTDVNSELVNKLSKIRGIYTERYSLCDELSSLPNIKRQRRENFQRFDFIISSWKELTDAYTTPVTSPQSQPSSNRNVLEFLYSKVLRDVLIEDVETSRNDMIIFCRQKYADNLVELNHVDDFDEYYQSENAIFWYTRDIFLYRLLNKALRDQDVRALYSLRYFTRDLHLKLKERYNSHLSPSLVSCTNSTVYRGQLMKNEEFDRKIRDNLGGFFATSCFLSTTEDRPLALVYAGNNKSTRMSEEQCVLFEIPIDNSIDKFSYANIARESAFGEAEKEVLFTMGVIFRILSITQDSNEDVWIVQLKLSDEEDEHLHVISSIIKKDMADPYKPLIKLIKIMGRMQYLDDAEHFSLVAIEDNSINSDFNLLSLVYYQLGVTYKSKKNINEAIIYFKKALNTKLENHISHTDSSLSSLYTNLGTVYENIGDYDRAHTYHNLAMKTLLDAETINQADLAIKYSNIASICRKKEYYLEALHNYTTCLDIESEILLKDDKKKLITKNNIGVVHIHLKNFTKAIEYFQMLETEQILSQYSSSNVNLAVVYWNLACVFYQQRHLTEALSYCRKCENIVTSRLIFVLHESKAKMCQDWIQRIEDELSKEQYQIRNGYGPNPWIICHPYMTSANLE
ncbi:unnamed protein product [Adineta steineri]|uniref:Uncharacterized protein n=1 Tax=Adineta steineri TaxID=433720 RepID=A0A815WTJ1_9BILA|nr:unnamed protein product [Adineta steineri]CAF1548393.1 unnamed protein product [Adineta steineri]